MFSITVLEYYKSRLLLEKIHQDDAKIFHTSSVNNDLISLFRQYSTFV